jgi:uncharacterized membrane protein
VGIIFCILGLISKIFPPKKINWIYGYRTSSSMKNIDTWNVANKYSTELMLMEGIVLTIVGVVTLFISDTGVAGAIMAIGLVLLSTIILIVATEKHLKKVFDKDGNRNQNI